MAKSIEFAKFIDELIQEVPSVEKEAIALAFGFNPHLKKDYRLKILKNYAKSQNLTLRRSALIAIAFSVLHEEKKGGKAQRKILNKYLKDSFSTVRLSAAICLSYMSLLSNNKKLQKSIFKYLSKRVSKEELQLKQGFAFGLGLLSKSIPPKKDISHILEQAFNSSEMGNTSVYLIGLTLYAMNTGNVERSFNFILGEIVPSLLDKESRRTAIICCAFLIPLVTSDKRVTCLRQLLEAKAEFHSRFGSDSALILTYFALYQEKAGIKGFKLLLKQYENVDTDYKKINEVISKDGVEKILVSLIKKNSLDLKAAAINASFFLENAGYKKELEKFVLAGLQTPASGYFDRFLILLRTFSYCLMQEDLTKLNSIKEMFVVPDSWVKRFAAMTYASLKWKFDPDSRTDIYLSIKKESNEHVRWGLLVGISISEVIGKSQLDDELILGLLLISLGHIEASTSLLISQVLVSKFYSENEDEK
ncbi:MAG: hypothetical protein ACTSW1_19295 [Candidatus Hodarchaeales archaeon]